MSVDGSTKPTVHIRYPVSSILIYNDVTVLHFLLGGTGLILGYGFSLFAYVFGLAYLVFAFFEMYVLMPLVVCPNCVYYKMRNSVCVSGLNIISRKIAKEGDTKNFGDRAKGLLCHNNLYMAALFFPIIGMLPALALYFSFLLLAILLGVVVLLLFRFFVIFPKIACVHCSAKNMCPNARQMGLQDAGTN